jgi:hypothetical protein
MRTTYVCLWWRLGGGSLWTWEIRKVPGCNIDRENQRAVVGDYEAMIVRDTDGLRCDGRSPVENMIDGADGSAVYSKESGL